MRILSRLTVCVIAQMSLLPGVSLGEVIGIPLKPDPPIAIDGDLGDWRTVPNALGITNATQVTYGAGAWTGASDLSGKVRFAWRTEYLFVAAEVVDDTISQRGRGQDVWKGDHLMLFLDVSPQQDAGRSSFGDGQYQIALSPGSLSTSGGPLLDTKPEAFAYKPDGMQLSGAEVAAVRTTSGYTIEAALPWSAFNNFAPSEGASLSFEIGVSDCDSPDPHQDSMMTSDARPWEITRTRLNPAMLAGTDGKPREASKGVPVFASLEVAGGAEKSVTFDVPQTPAGLEAILTFKARMQFEKVAGCNPALALRLNGKPVEATRMINKPQRAKARGGDIYSLGAGERIVMFYSPDFESTEKDPHYGLVDKYPACYFELRVSDLLQTGTNQLTVANTGTPDLLLVAADAQLVDRAHAENVQAKAGRPTGALPFIRPKQTLETAFTMAEQPDCAIDVTIGEKTFHVTTRFSTPRPGWVTGSNESFDHKRELRKESETIVVRDTLTNRTDQPLAIMHRHECNLGDAVERVWLGGLEQLDKAGSISQPANPTVCAGSSRAALGMLPLDDVFRLHASVFALDGTVGLADNNLVLAPGATYTTEWAVVPLPAADYFDFLNVARRLVNANFTVDGGFAFLRNGPLTDVWTDQQVADFIRFKDPKYICACGHPTYNGQFPHGTIFHQLDFTSFRESFARWRRLEPNREYLVYFHCFLDVREDGPTLFADARLLSPDGKQTDYGEESQRLYFPTENNSFGPEIAKNVDDILGPIGADGVYWDEHEYSRWQYHYGEPWDGFSGDIDPTSMTVTRLKSSVTLLTEPWRLALAKRILAKGPLIGNGPPFTRAMAALQFPCFVETGSITNCTQAHLYSPIALGDHLTERSEQDAYGIILAALDFGCVYHWYNDLDVVPTHPHITSFMYPITPMELHEGYIIGKERIITNRSGLFGWGDMSAHEVHVFDDTGREAPGFQTKEVVKDDARYTEVRIGEGWSAAIVRK
ncbi:MAG: hypothetical protein K1Y02_07085 [Candidatus Hydrogenedentes bacterium]|nr:hypothetical protein [Candidatus Hydrogenedentota bacterium]